MSAERNLTHEEVFGHLEDARGRQMTQIDITRYKPVLNY